MSGYKSLHQRLLEEGYRPEAVINDKRLPEELTALALDLARGKYTTVKLVPADLILSEKHREEQLEIAEQSHVVYAVLGDAEKKSGEGTANLVSLICSYKPTGERVIVFLKNR